MRSEFKNEPLLDFTIPENRTGMQQALDEVRSGFGTEYKIIIGHDEILTSEKINSINPSQKDEVIGVCQRGMVREAEKAIDIAAEAFASWRWKSAEERAGVLFRAADIMRERRYELDALMVFEVGKNWVEADGDVAEAIDFLEFYGREAIRYAQPQPLVRIPSEDNELRYIPLGVGVVIPPWNFPLAILVGMTSAAIVAGNTVVLKPSSDAPVLGAKFTEIFHEAGLPPGVLNFVTGGGGQIGDYLVEHPQTRLIAFTGSMEVGLRINALAAQTKPGQIWIKRVIAEMGGKDSIIVDSEADLEAAALGVVLSAFGFQGQKCSACSRAIIHQDVYDDMIDRVALLTRKITVGPPEDQNNFMGPVINDSAKKTILDYIAKGKKEGRLIVGGDKPSDEGFFINPTVIADVNPYAVISQEEIFGPVLAIIKARDYEDALAIANNTIYGLTGAVYTDNKGKIKQASDWFHCGNLYFNRKCTGALVGVHPFGGFNMSGTDSKAGGRDYLLLFTQAKCISTGKQN